MGGWESGNWGPGWGASGWWCRERRDILHLHRVHHLRRRLLDLAATFGCQLHRSVAACKGLAVHSRICVRLGCLHHLFMHLIWEMSTRQKFLMAWRDRKHPVLCKLKTSHKAPDPGNTRLPLWTWKRNFTGKLLKGYLEQDHSYQQALCYFLSMVVQLRFCPGVQHCH